MCLYPPPRKPKQSGKGKQRVSKDDIRDATAEAMTSVVNDFFPRMAGCSSAAPPPVVSRSHLGCAFQHWHQQPDENQVAQITKGQWKEHTATCTGTHDAVKSNATKIDACKSAAVDAVKEVKTAVAAGHSTGKDTQAAVKEAQEAIKETHEAVKAAQNAVKEVHDSLKLHRGETLSEHSAAAAEIAKVRAHQEEETRQRVEAAQRQQTMQDAWSYAQYLRQQDREACQHPFQVQQQPQPPQQQQRGGSSSRSSSRTSSSSGSGGSSSSSSKRRRRREEDEKKKTADWRQVIEEITRDRVGFVSAEQKLQEVQEQLQRERELERQRERERELEWERDRERERERERQRQREWEREREKAREEASRAHLRAFEASRSPSSWNHNPQWVHYGGSPRGPYPSAGTYRDEFDSSDGTPPPASYPPPPPATRRQRRERGGRAGGGGGGWYGYFGGRNGLPRWH
ncbi:hypothetical protein F4780DRAFT_381908 [Xylariomycetidae sp. FL0641]|nr:hypothetical protein F4780DRAFT_381908 [Xylariomycetidae sp. FL0641]